MGFFYGAKFAKGREKWYEWSQIYGSTVVVSGLMVMVIDDHLQLGANSDDGSWVQHWTVNTQVSLVIQPYFKPKQ